MRLKWTLPLVLVPVALYACGTQLTIPPDSDVDGGGGDASAEANGEAAAADAPSADAGTVCTPSTCAGLNAQCGSAPNGCGGALDDCGVCPSAELCGAGGPNRCGDGGCDAATSCAAGRCGTISNGCGGTLDCGGCTGDSYCVNGTSKCERCTVLGPDCSNIGGDICLTHPATTNTAYVCNQPPVNPACVFCPSLNGTGKVYCCP